MNAAGCLNLIRRRAWVVPAQAPEPHGLDLLDRDEHGVAVAPLGGLVDLLDRIAGQVIVRWAAWNLVRVATSTGAFACLAWALVLYGRSTA
jgi:hypothetical protein